MSAQELWSEVDRFVGGALVEEDEALLAAVRACEAAGMPPIAVSPSMGKLLALLVRMCGARTVLELGTLAGYSTIWLARAVADGGRVVTLELDPEFARIAAANLERAGVSDRVELRVGAATDSLADLIERGAGPFDFVFIDADKKSTPAYFELVLALCRPGSVILTDNVVRRGAVADPDTADEGAAGMRRFHEQLAAAGEVSATTIQTVGVKGYDGFTLALVGER